MKGRKIIPILFLMTAVVFPSMLLVNCKASHAIPQDTLKPAKHIQEKLGDNTVTEYNDARTYALVRQVKESSKAGEPVAYAVVRLTDQVIVYEGKFRGGYVKWIDNHSIEVFNVPGKVKADEDLSKYKKQIDIGSSRVKSDL